MHCIPITCTINNALLCTRPYLHLLGKPYTRAMPLFMKEFNKIDLSYVKNSHAKPGYCVGCRGQIQRRRRWCYCLPPGCGLSAAFLDGAFSPAAPRSHECDRARSPCVSA